MKSRDKILFAFPLLLGLLVLVSAGTLFLSTEKFEESYVSAEKRNIMTEAETFADVIRPMLASGDFAAVSNYCMNFSEKILRVTLVRADGTVIVDSAANEHALENHAAREEVAGALAGTPSVSSRFSATKNERMIYCAMPVDIDGRTEFVLRLAIRNSEIESIIAGAKRNNVLALALGVFVALAIAFYILIRVRSPLVQLQESAQRISLGDLRERISVPEKGVVRELAITVSRMKEQLKSQLDRITAERNARERIFAALSEAVLLFAENGDALYFNGAAREVFGLEPGATKFNLARCGSPELLVLADKAFRDGVPVEAEITLEIEGGAPRTLFAKGGTLEDDGHRRLLVAITDLTNLRRLESFRSDFVANVSHEIKTPLTGILGAVDALESGALDNPVLREKFLGILSSQAKRLNALVHDVLSLAAIERQQISGECEAFPFRLDAALENAVNSCLPRAEAAGTTLKITENDPVEFNGDARLIEQAVINLISNAIKYSGSPTVEISLKKSEGSAEISVRDFGVGISQEHLSRIFERFYSADKAHSRALGGTGLGLAIVKHIARLHGGNASVESSLGNGCLFRISLPLRNA